MRIENDSEKGELVAAFGGSVGLSYRLGWGIVWSNSLEAEIDAGADCDQTCRLNVGPAVALLWQKESNAAFSAELRYQLRLGDETDDRFEVRLGQSYGLHDNWALKLELTIEDEGIGRQQELLSTINWYF